MKIARLSKTAAPISVVVPKLGDEQSVIRDLANEAVFEGFRFADTLERFSFGFLDKLVDSIQDLFVGFLPVQIDI